MGKASKWFREILGLKKPNPLSPAASPRSRSEPNRRWSFVKHSQHKQQSGTPDSAAGCRRHSDICSVEPAPSSAFATSATAAAAVSSTSATLISDVSPAAAVGTREIWAAIMIQSIFRSYLARRALRALKALVKLQALVRGHMVRKDTAEIMRRMQSLLRAQARALSGRSQVSESPNSSSKSSQFHHAGPSTPEKSEYIIDAKSLNREQGLTIKKNCSTISSQEQPPSNSPRNDVKIKLYTGKPSISPRRRNLFHSSDSVLKPSSCKPHPLPSLTFEDQDVEEISFCMVENSPQFYPASSKGNRSLGGPFTPSKSESSRSCHSNYLDHPNYMSYTESSRAKARSLSAPKQRHLSEDSIATVKKNTNLHANFASRAYPGSGRLDRLGMPVGVGRADRLSGSCYWNRY